MRHYLYCVSRRQIKYFVVPIVLNVYRQLARFVTIFVPWLDDYELFLYFLVKHYLDVRLAVRFMIHTATILFFAVVSFVHVSTGPL
jgi:hypothetical protein